MADGTLGLRIWDTNKALFVLICGLNGKFLEIGIIPPCKTYGGGEYDDGEECWGRGAKGQGQHLRGGWPWWSSQGDRSLGPDIWGSLM